MFPADVYEKLKSLHIVLASGSKIRENLLKRLNLNIEVYVPNFEENLDPLSYTVSEYVAETALGKVLDVEEFLKNRNIRPDMIIGADTMVEYSGQLYGKPENKEEAASILAKLTSSGLPNVVHTGIVIKYKDQIIKFVETTSVYMTKLTTKELSIYVNTEEAANCAGGYAIQGLASAFIEKIDGDYNNVTGLPLCRLRKELIKLFTVNGFQY